MKIRKIERIVARMDRAAKVNNQAKAVVDYYPKGCHFVIKRIGAAELKPQASTKI